MAGEKDYVLFKGIDLRVRVLMLMNCETLDKQYNFLELQFLHLRKIHVGVRGASVLVMQGLNESKKYLL